MRHQLLTSLLSSLTPAWYVTMIDNNSEYKYILVLYGIDNLSLIRTCACYKCAIDPGRTRFN